MSRLTSRQRYHKRGKPQNADQMGGHHEDDQNVKMGLELIKNGGLPNGLLTPLLLTYLQQSDEKLKKECWNLLNLALDDETIQVIQYPKHLWQKNENSKKKYIQRLVKTGWFEGIQLNL